MPEADMVNPSSSDTEEVLDLLFLSPARGHHSLALNLHLGSDSDAFEDWLKANDMAASVYVALTTDALSSRVSTIDNPCVVRESCTSSLSGRQSCSWLASSKNPHQRKTTLTSTLQRKSKKTKIDAGVLLRHPHRAVVHFLPLILIRMSEKLCTLILSRRTSSTLPNM
jgi:hypothetical protein